MAERPSFQFYLTDWRANSKLQRCSLGARGAWIEVLCLLHDSDEYGVLRWPLADIARAAKLPIKLLRELALKGVLKGADQGAVDFVHRPFHAGRYGEPITLVTGGGGSCWYCSRFVRDAWLRRQRGRDTRFSHTNQPSKPTPSREPTGRVGERQGDGSSSASAASMSSLVPIPDVNSLEGEVGAGDSVGFFEGHDAEAESIATDQGRALVALAVALKAAGCSDASASNPHLTTVLRDGVTHQELLDTAGEFPGKPIKYLVNTIRGRRADAQTTTGKPALSRAAATFNPDGPSPARETETPQEREENWARQCHTFGQLSASELATKLTAIRSRYSGASVAAAEN